MNMIFVFVPEVSSMVCSSLRTLSHVVQESLIFNPWLKKYLRCNKQKTWQVINCREVSDNENVWRSIFILFIKHPCTECNIWTSYFGFRGHNGKSLIVPGISILHTHSTGMTVGVATILGFRLLSVDSTLIYLQFNAGHQQGIFIQPRSQFKQGSHKFLEPLESVYNLIEFVVFWKGPYRKHFLQ